MGPTSEQPTNDLEQTLERIKVPENSTLSAYHKDCIKWSKNVDKRYAWVVLAALWFAMVGTLGPYRIFGLIYAKVTEDGIYSREDASTPVSMIFTTENLVGPLVSIVTYYITFRQSMLIGGLLVMLGTGLTAISNSLWLDALLLGVCQGFGYAFIFMPIMSFINSYFVLRRNIAWGLALTGGSVSVFFLTPLFRWLLDNYPWRYSYLGCAAVQSLILIAVPFLKPNPKPQPPMHHNPIAVKQQFTEGGTLSRMSVRALTYQNSLRRQSTIMIARKAVNESTYKSPISRQSSVVSMNPFASTAGLERKISRDMMNTIIEGEKKNPTNNTIASKPQHPQLAKVSDLYETVSLSEVEPKEGEFELSMIWSIFKTPAFYLILMNELIYYWIFTIYCLVMVDYGLDRGCSKSEAQSLLSLQSVGEFIGRVFLTILIDLHLVSNRNSVIIVLFLLSALLALVTQVFGFLWMAGITVGLASLLALLFVLLNGLLVDYLGESKVTLGYGISSCIGGALMILRPQAVGYFRDTIGSYDPLMLCLSASCTLIALLWLIEPLIAKLVGRSHQPTMTRETSKAAHLDSAA